MFSKLGLYQTVAIGAVVVGVAGWAIYSQTNWFKPAPVIEASDAPLAVASVADETEVAVTEVAPEQSTEPTEVHSEVERDADEVEETVEDSVADVPDTTEVEEVVEEDQQDQEPVAEIEFAVPTFDVVRVESDGMTVVAGTGPAGWMISILVDGEVAETVEADGSGQFVAFLELGESEHARVITLSAKNADRILMSDAQVIIAPVVRQVAEVEPDVVVVEATDEASVEDDPVAEDTSESVGVAAVEVDTDAVEMTDSASNSEGDATVEMAEVAEPVAELSDETEGTVSVQNGDTEVATEETEVAQVTPAVETESADLATDASAETTEVVQATSDTEPALEEGTVEIAEVSTESAEIDTAEPSSQEPAVEETPMVEEPATSEESTIVEAETASEPVAETAPIKVEVVEDSSPAVILVENDNVTVLQPAASTPQVLDQLSIAAISYSDAGEVQISGFSPAGFLRVYLNNVQIAVLEVPEPGEWQAELVDVEPGVYTLRVDQVDEQGEVVQRVETPFKREEPAKVVEAAQSRKPLVSVEVVQPGSTLWAISRETYGSGVLYVNIFEANKDQIRSPHLIYPGQIFELPAPPGAKKKKRTSGQ